MASGDEGSNGISRQTNNSHNGQRDPCRRSGAFYVNISGVSKLSGARRPCPPTFCIKWHICTSFMLICKIKYHRRPFPFVYIPKTLTMMLKPIQRSKIPSISRTFVTRPLHFESCFDAPCILIQGASKQQPLPISPSYPVYLPLGHREGAGANCPRASRSKLPHKFQCNKVCGPHKVNQQ